MRKNLCLMLALLALLSLCACGGAPAPTEPPQPTETVQPTEAPTPTATPEPAQTPAQTKETLFEAAQACIDQPVETLYAAIGQPQSSDYAPSCLEVGGEDGNLYYEGFTVYTLRTAEGETVIFVE